ncbi:MAG: Flp family type IVb pilin [Xanthobacteraceae bacterium]|nr:Flp family type IVb pilin [Xanthobacteraceae bacterium]
MRRLLVWFIKDEAGVTAIEYAMIAGGIATVIIGTVQMLGSTTAGLYQSALDGFAPK